jgi:hypothetical protein
MTAIILQVSGTLLLTVAGWLVDPALGCAVGGIGLLAFGLAIEGNG